MPFSLSPDRFVVPAHVVSRDVAGAIVLLDTERGEYFTLDEIGTAVWRALTTAASMIDAHRQLLDEYDIDPVELEQDVAALVDQLEQRGLIEVRPAAI